MVYLRRLNLTLPIRIGGEMDSTPSGPQAARHANDLTNRILRMRGGKKANLQERVNEYQQIIDELDKALLDPQNPLLDVEGLHEALLVELQDLKVCQGCFVCERGRPIN